MGVLAGRPFEPAKRSAIHGRQREQDATVKWAGDWRRAYDYGDPEAEALAVHEHAGVIDVSTLGKLLVRGPDAGEILDRLYPNRFSNLKPGRIRYGVMTSDAGRIMDDGTICRLDDDSFYVTTTSSGAGAIEEWFGWWLADVGPRRARHRRHPGALARSTSRGRRRARSSRSLTDLDVSPEALHVPRRQAREGRRASTRCCCGSGSSARSATRSTSRPPTASTSGTRSWRRARGRSASSPSGSCGCRSCTSSSARTPTPSRRPYGAAMPWIVKLDKEQDFIGRWALEHAAEHRAELALVGFTMPNGHVPTEGAVVLARRAGHVVAPLAASSAR